MNEDEGRWAGITINGVPVAEHLRKLEDDEKTEEAKCLRRKIIMEQKKQKTPPCIKFRSHKPESEFHGLVKVYTKDEIAEVEGRRLEKMENLFTMYTPKNRTKERVDMEASIISVAANFQNAGITQILKDEGVEIPRGERAPMTPPILAKAVVGLGKKHGLDLKLASTTTKCRTVFKVLELLGNAQTKQLDKTVELKFRDGIFNNTDPIQLGATVRDKTNELVRNKKKATKKKDVSTGRHPDTVTAEKILIEIAMELDQFCKQHLNMEITNLDSMSDGGVETIGSHIKKVIECLAGQVEVKKLVSTMPGNGRIQEVLEVMKHLPRGSSLRAEKDGTIIIST